MAERMLNYKIKIFHVSNELKRASSTKHLRRRAEWDERRAAKALAPKVENHKAARRLSESIGKSPFDQRFKSRTVQNDRNWRRFGKAFPAPPKRARQLRMSGISTLPHRFAEGGADFACRTPPGKGMRAPRNSSGETATVPKYMKPASVGFKIFGRLRKSAQHLLRQFGWPRRLFAPPRPALSTKLLDRSWSIRWERSPSTR